MADTIEEVSETEVPETEATADVATPAEVIAETPVVETAEDLPIAINENIVTETIKSDPAVYDEALFHTAIFYKAIKGLTSGAQDTIAINNSRQGHVAYMLSTAAFAALSANAASTYTITTKSLTWAKNSSRVFSMAVKPNVIFALQTRSLQSSNVGGRKVWTPTIVAYLVNPAIYDDLITPPLGTP